MVTTFLYGFINQIIFVKQLHLFELNSRLVCCLCKALYRLKQASQVWYKTLPNFLTKLGLKRLKLDYDVFVLQDRQLFLLIYVDDLLFFISDKSRLINIQDQLGAWFKRTNLGKISHYLGMKVDVEVGKEIYLQQTAYLKKILRCFQMIEWKLVSICINPSVTNSFFLFKQQADQATIKQY